MSVDKEVVERIAHQARIRLLPEEKERMCEEIRTVLAFDEQLNEVDIKDVEPLISTVTEPLIMREDKVCAGGDAQSVLANAPVQEENFFLIPKVVE